MINRRFDSLRFISIAISIKFFGIAFATLIFAEYTPLVDSQLYLSGFYQGSSELRNNLVGWLAISLNYFGGPYLAYFAFALISILGVVYYFQTGGRRWPLLLPLLLPSTLVWSSIVGKEAIYIGFSGLATVVWSSYVIRELRWYEVLIVAVCLGVCFLLRPHYAIALLWLFLATFSLKRLGGGASALLVSLLAIGALSVYVFVWDELLWRGFTTIESSARASRFELFRIVPMSVEGFREFKSYLPLGIFIGIVGPLPSEVLNRIEFLPFLMEGVLILSSPLMIYCWAIQHPPPQIAAFKRVFWWAVIPAVVILMVIHAPFGLLNPGSAVRWRTNFEQIFYLAPLLLLYRFKDSAR